MASEVCLVTGGAGFIGSNLIDHLIQRMPVVAIDNFDPFYPETIKRSNIKHLESNENFSFYKADILDTLSLDVIVKKHKITQIIHLAAKAGVRPSLKDPKGYVQTNVQGTLNLLESAKKYNITKFVFGSSSSVYGSRSGEAFSEEMKLDKPISPYAATKLSGEQLCYVYHHLYNLPIVSFRFFTVYGPRQRPDQCCRGSRLRKERRRDD